MSDPGILCPQRARFQTEIDQYNDGPADLKGNDLSFFWDMGRTEHWVLRTKYSCASKERCSAFLPVSDSILQNHFEPKDSTGILENK